MSQYCTVTFHTNGPLTQFSAMFIVHGHKTVDSSIFLIVRLHTAHKNVDNFRIVRLRKITELRTFYRANFLGKIG